MSVTARVRVTLDVPVISTWTEETPIKQIKSQAVDDVNRILETAFEASQYAIKRISSAECITIKFNAE